MRMHRHGIIITLLGLSLLGWGCSDDSGATAGADVGGDTTADTGVTEDTDPATDTGAAEDAASPDAAPTDPTELFAGVDVVWEPCPLVEGEEGSEAGCASTEMPLFWEAHDGQTTSIREKRLRPEGEVTAQVWLVHGGPGASGVVGFPSLMSGLHDLMPGLEVYTLDHRGTGYSGFLECPEQQRPDSEYGAGISDAELEGCIAAMRALQGEGLSTLGSTSSAIDLAAYIEASRRPDTPVYLWGGSYGAYLALRFLRLFPEGVDGVIIEGIVKPDVTFINHDETSDRAGRWLLEECAADEACAARLGDDPAATLAEAMARHDVGACEHVPIDSQSFQQLLVYIMYSWVTSGVVPALIHRYHRCAPEDGEALMFLWEFLFGEEGAWVADTTDRSYSLLLQLHVIHSEMWEHPDYDLEEVPGTLEAFWGECLFCRRNIQTYVDTHDVWPRYDDSAYGDSYAESDVPMLMMHGRLDPTASAPEAEEVGAWFTGANQTFVMFPQAAHNISSGTPYRPLRPHCGMKLWLDFMADPTAALDTSCVAEVQPINFEGTEPLARALLGTGSFFELEGDGKAAPVAPDPAALEALRALRRRVQVDRLQRRLRSPALGR